MLFNAHVRVVLAKVCLIRAVSGQVYIGELEADYFVPLFVNEVPILSRDGHDIPCPKNIAVVDNGTHIKEYVPITNLIVGSVVNRWERRNYNRNIRFLPDHRGKRQFANAALKCAREGGITSSIFVSRIENVGWSIPGVVDIETYDWNVPIGTNKLPIARGQIFSFLNFTT